MGFYRGNDMAICCSSVKRGRRSIVIALAQITISPIIRGVEGYGHSQSAPRSFLRASADFIRSRQ